MKFKVIASIIFILLVAVGFMLFFNKHKDDQEIVIELLEENEEHEAAYQYLRWKYEADMIKDPTTGEVLFGLRDQEVEFARTIPERNTSSVLARLTTQNNYIPAGPNNIGGRTRAIAYDVRYNGTSNRVLMAGGISGGIFRSTDGGANWTRVTPANEVHNVSCIAQDPRVGFQDIWYAGGGEYIGSSTDATGAGYLAYGLLKSIDNGATWIRLSLTNITDFNGSTIGAGVPERFDHPFDYVHKISVSPANGDVYVACHRRIVRSSNGGTTFQTVFGSAVSGFAAGGQGDVVISPFGIVYVAVTGAASDLDLRGIWKSSTGNLNSYTRLAGGSILGFDSVAGWRGNSYSFTDVSGSNFYEPRRTLLALANENILYVLYENGLTNTSSGRNKEADLFKVNMSSGNVWTNLSGNLPDFPLGDHDATDPFTIQGGYDLFITVKPDDPNFVLLGGTSLYRSTDGFSTTNYNNTLCWIGGYGNTLPSLTFYPNSHPDIHNVVFNPSNPNEAICSNDGGMQMTTNISAAGSNVVWVNINNYQTLQYYKVAIDPEIGANNFAGGAQDNGTQFRDKTGILGIIPSDSNNHRRVLGGDGGSVGISKKNGNVQYLYSSIQLGAIRRGQLLPSLTPNNGHVNITPSNLTGSGGEYGEFVTNFKLNPDNTEDLYYINFNRLFRTINASAATPTWMELTGVSGAVNSGNGTNIAIRAIAFSRGNYGSLHTMYFGTTDGRIFRLDDPRNSAATMTPVNITPTVTDMTGLNVQDIAVNPNNDNEIIAVVTNYGRTVGANLNNVTNILCTNDAKSASPTWRVAEGNLTGNNTSGYISARSCIITVKKDGSGNPVTEYYVGTAAGLFAVENLGTTLIAGGSPTWQREGSSTLNFAVINSLAYRPVDNVLLVGTHGNGLYYTFLGTSNLVTGINNPVINDKDFITKVYPTISESMVQYLIGNKPDVKKISVQLFNMQGQELYRLETGYQSGSFNINRFAKGAYILSIYSDNKKYRHVQKIIR